MITKLRIEEHSPRVVVVGAGPAGLASAAELGRRGLPVVVLEQADSIGASWRGRYDRLRLNSSRPFSKLPRMRYTRGTGIFPARDQIIGYLERYAARNRLDIRLGTHVERIDQDERGWVLRTSRGDVRADQVVVAAGYAHTPFIPAWPGRERFRGTLIHAAEYRNADRFRGRDVLVVGSGCSGAEIAHELACDGAARVRLAVRTPPNILLRNPIGPLLARTMLKLLPPDRADAVLRFVRRREIGDLSEYGLPVPEEGVFTRLKRLGVAPTILDPEVVESIKDRRIEIVPGVESLDETGVTLAGGTRIEPDAVIAATGYRCALEPVVGHLGVLNERGVPHVVEQEAAPGLRFIGYVPRPAHIGYMGAEAKRAAREIARVRPPARSVPRAAAARPAVLSLAGGDAEPVIDRFQARGDA
jgi:NADPH-dependent 2,4-dienoyl-CoA reductase/sulfur reductase-like enzyme